MVDRDTSMLNANLTHWHISERYEGGFSSITYYIYSSYYILNYKRNAISSIEDQSDFPAASANAEIVVDR